MKYSKMCDFKGKSYFICKTGTMNIRILEPGKSYNDAFVVPINQISNRRPADLVPQDAENQNLAEHTEETEDLVDFIPR